MAGPALRPAPSQPIDAAFWDLKAKILGQPLVALLGRQRDSVAIYGSGGFTTYSDDQLRDQLSAGSNGTDADPSR